MYHHINVKLSGKKMSVWVVEVPHDFHTLTHRLLVYKSMIANDDSFIGYADYREEIA